MKKVLFVFGTRPEAIKMAPLILEMQKRPDIFNVLVCVTGQHRQMLDQVLKFFKIRADFDLDIMRPNQTLTDITAVILSGVAKVIEHTKPDLVFVQGDTTTACFGAVAAFYQKVKVAHIEAGLRSGNKYSPFPEEINRILIGHTADYHFAPTKRAADSLAKEGISQNVWIVGNTGIDALFLGLEILNRKSIDFSFDFPNVNFSHRIILVTGHRRESFGVPFENICLAIKNVVDAISDAEVVYPVHLNPNVQEPVKRILKNRKRIHLLEPLEYQKLIWLMNKSYFVLTDSGGIQEEAPSLGKPVLVMRDVTERLEGIEAGTALLVGTNKEAIEAGALKLLRTESIYKKMANKNNPYGDGTACKQIIETFVKHIFI